MPRYSETTLTAIKRAVDITDLVGEYLTLHRSGSKFKALCPFHDDHNPSLELNSERQSFRCWSCGAGGDVFNFVMDIEKVEFPEALRMLAERAGIPLEAVDGDRSAAPSGPSKTELLAVLDWAAGAFAKGLEQSSEAQIYLETRGISPASVERFGLGFAPDSRDWLTGLARKQGFAVAALEQAGLVGRSAENPTLLRERFRGRLIFPIRDFRGRTIAFGGRILPELQRRFEAEGRGVAKYLNSPETLVFKKSRNLYAADLARPEARRLNAACVVEGYTDVIAAHQAGLTNFVGTLGTALGDDHATSLRRLADRVVLVFDGDEAGQKAADRALEIFLNHELDVRVLALPGGIDPADFLAEYGVDDLRRRLEQAVDPMAFLVERARTRFDLDSAEGARQAAEAILGLLAAMPRLHRTGVDVKVGQALNNLASRLRLPVTDISLPRRLGQLLKSQNGRRIPQVAQTPAESGSAVAESPPIRPIDLDSTDRWLIGILLNQPALVGQLITKVFPATLRDASLRVILQACYDVHAEGEIATFDRVLRQIRDPAVRSLAVILAAPEVDPAPLPDSVRPGSIEARLAGVLSQLAERDRQQRLRDLKSALDETSPEAEPEQHRALRQEYFRLLHQRPDPRKLAAS